MLLILRNVFKFSINRVSVESLFPLLLNLCFSLVIRAGTKAAEGVSEADMAKRVRVSAFRFGEGFSMHHPFEPVLIS